MVVHGSIATEFMRLQRVCILICASTVTVVTNGDCGWVTLTVGIVSIHNEKEIGIRRRTSVIT